MVLPIHKILCPTDFSDPSYEGLQAAVELARHFKAELLIAHVVNPMPILPESSASAGTYLPTLLKEIEDSAKISLQALAEERVPEGIPVQTKVVVGTPAKEITQMAVSENADIICIATHGQSGWKRFISGSVTERVLRISDRPVLTVHAPGENHEEDTEE